MLNPGDVRITIKIWVLTVRKILPQLKDSLSIGTSQK